MSARTQRMDMRGAKLMSLMRTAVLVSAFNPSLVRKNRFLKAASKRCLLTACMQVFADARPGGLSIGRELGAKLAIQTDCSPGHPARSLWARPRKAWSRTATSSARRWARGSPGSRRNFLCGRLCVVVFYIGRLDDLLPWRRAPPKIKALG